MKLLLNDFFWQKANLTLLWDIAFFHLLIHVVNIWFILTPNSSWWKDIHLKITKDRGSELKISKELDQFSNYFCKRHYDDMNLPSSHSFGIFPPDPIKHRCALGSAQSQRNRYYGGPWIERICSEILCICQHNLSPMGPKNLSNIGKTRASGNRWGS